MMKKIILSLITLLFTTSIAASQPSIDISAHTRHVWRGQAGPDAISIQPDIRIPLSSNGTSVGLWGQVPIRGDATEIDLTVAQDIGKIGTLTATAYYYDGPFLEVDSHDVEVSFAASYEGVDLMVGYFVSGDAVKNDKWLQVGYDIGGFGVFAGVGDGNYITDDDDMGLVVIGAEIELEGGYGASFMYNADTESPFLIASKRW